MSRLMAAKFKPAPKVFTGINTSPPPIHTTPPRNIAAPVPTSALVPRGSCKAINLDTGRQCALLAGHTTAHRHGRTDFVRCAEPGETTFARRRQLDELASATGASPFTAISGDAP